MPVHASSERPISRFLGLVNALLRMTNREAARLGSFHQSILYMYG